MRLASFPDRPTTGPLLAGIFAGDLRQRSEQVFEVFADQRRPGRLNGHPVEVLCLPITIPTDERGLVLLGPATLDCEKQPAVMEVVRPGDPQVPYRFGIGLALVDGSPMLVPGVNLTGSEDEPPRPVHELTFAVADDGCAVVGFGPDRTPVDVTLTENTACLLATALLIAFGVKLVKADHGLT